MHRSVNNDDLFLGIDQSYTSTGLVVLDRHKQIVHHELFKTPKTEDTFVRCWNISEHIVKMIVEYDIKSIAIEGLAFGMMGNATRDLAGLQFTIVNKVRQILKKDLEIISPLSLKKFATGDGKAKKEDMIAALSPDTRDMFLKAGYKKTTGLADITDAYFLARYILGNTQ